MPSKKIELWSPSQQAEARQDGWELVDTIDNGNTKPRLRLFASVPNHTNQGALMHVLNQAKTGSALHIQALRAMAASAAFTKGSK
jgi:hypothetical protein